jgi:pSer/pThr/pTyr-binding forkhead associated (FHA) protein
MEDPKRPVRTRATGVELPPGAALRVLSGFYEGLEVPVDRDWLVIGRGRGADLMLADPTVSRAHAAIGYDARGFFLQDLGSTNGTWCNGRSCERARLGDGDEVQVGTLRLALRVPPRPAEDGAR